MLIIAAYHWQSEWNPCCEPIFWAAPELRFRRWGQNSVPATLADQKRVSRKEDVWYSLHTMISTYHKDLGTNIINSFLRFVVAIVTTNVSGKEIKYLFYNHTLEDRRFTFRRLTCGEGQTRGAPSLRDSVSLVSEAAQMRSWSWQHWAIFNTSNGKWSLHSSPSSVIYSSGDEI